mgnify:CR=1 FL=1
MHFGEAIDGPHTWRQSDTAHYIWDYYQSDINLMEPSVCWMGGNDKVALEFPLPEAIAAVIHKVMGPSLIWSRLFFFLIYLAGAYYFYQILRIVAPEGLARLTVLLYMSLPLGLFYSRAIHVDFSAVLCAHGMLYFALVSIRKLSMPHFLISMVFATIGFLIKAPYLFFLALPLMAFAIRERKFVFLLKNAIWLVFPIGLFLLWQVHVRKLNGAMPDWSFIPQYHKMDDMSGWYFGDIKHRFEGFLWEILFDRLKFGLAAVTGLPVLIAGINLGWKRFHSNFMRLWLFGAVIYLLIFFTLNVIHDYYQIPFLVPLAYFVALPIYYIYRAAERFNRKIAFALATIAFLIIAGQSLRLTEGYALSEAEKKHFGGYYKVNELVYGAGQVIRAHTPEESLVITTFGGLDCRCPNLLYASRRKGWSIPKQDISVDIVQKLQSNNASHYALLQVEPLSDSLEAYLKQFLSLIHI